MSSPPTSPKTCGPQPEALASLFGPQAGPISRASCRDSPHAGNSSHHGAGQHWWKQLHSSSTNQPPSNNRGTLPSHPTHLLPVSPPVKVEGNRILLTGFLWRLNKIIHATCFLLV